MVKILIGWFLFVVAWLLLIKYDRWKNGPM